MFGEHLNAHLEREEPVAVLMLDIDNFKDVNDTFGHVYGDQVLIEIGKLLLKQVNENVGFTASAEMSSCFLFAVHKTLTP